MASKSKGKRLSDAEKSKIKSMRAAGATIAEIAKEVGVSAPTVVRLSSKKRKAKAGKRDAPLRKGEAITGIVTFTGNKALVSEIRRILAAELPAALRDHFSKR